MSNNNGVYALTVTIQGVDIPICIHHKELDETSCNAIERALLQRCKQSDTKQFKLEATATVQLMPEIYV